MRVDGATFEFLEQGLLPEWTMRVKVTGEGFKPRAAPVRAFVGDEPVEGILPNRGNGGVIRYPRPPPPGGAAPVGGYPHRGPLPPRIGVRPPAREKGRGEG